MVASWRLDNDVLLTQSGVAFLAGGNHQTLKFASGELQPSAESLDSFAQNIDERHRNAGEFGSKYAHIIFPDKQSILVDEFPFQPVVRLGDTYLAHISPRTSRHVIYPASQLQATPGACLPLDTHLSATGSLVVLRQMLEKVGVQADEGLSRIGSCISQPREWSGDLGGKFDPPLNQKVLTLAPDWAFTAFTSGGSSNDGIVDILFNPDAPINKTVLMFGDSFFRLMLRHMTGIFTRVICLRTRFYHSEMVNLIDPDIVFTGNAERYLSRVDSDDEASPFMLYRARRGEADDFTPDFLAAWLTVTSPRASQSQIYLKKYGVTRST